MNARYPSSGRTRAVSAIHEVRNEVHAASLAPRPARTAGALGSGFFVVSFSSTKSDVKFRHVLHQYALQLGLSGISELLTLDMGEIRTLSQQKR